MAFVLSVKQPVGIYSDTTGFPIEVEVTTSHSDMPKEVFVWHAAMGANTIVPTDAFAAVCSLEQLASLPTAPAEGEEMQIPFYRSKIARIVARNAEEAASFVTELKSDLVRLRRDYDAAATLVEHQDEA